MTEEFPTEQLAAENGRSVLRMERRLSHPPDVVWRAVTAPDQLSRWFPADLTFEPKVDAKVEFVFRNEEGPPGSGVVTDYDPPRVFAYTWDSDHLRWEVRPDGEGSVLKLTHTFDDGAGAAMFAAGWEICLSVLAQALAGQEVRPPADWASRHEALIAKLGLTGGRTEVTADGWTVRFERQLVAPPDVAWSALVGPAGRAGHHQTDTVDTPAIDAPAPSGFVRDDLPSTTVTAVTAVEPASLLEYEVRSGYRVRWELQPDPGGARLVLTETRTDGAGESGADAADAAAAAWQEQIERLAARMLAAHAS